MIGNFDAGHRLLDHGKNDLNERYPTFRQKLDLFFIDYDLIPLLIQESYLNSMGDRKTLADLEAMGDASDFISLGDSVSRQVRQNQDWSLLPNLGLCSSLAPALIIKGSSFYPRFPEWLGKNSSQRKAKRLIRELKRVMGHHAQAPRMEIQAEYVPLVLGIILRYIRRKDAQGAIEVMEDLGGLTNEHMKEHLMGLCMDDKVVRAFEDLDSGTKAAFTREYNKQHKEQNLVGKKGVSKGAP
jgi:replication factor C subunit 1